MINSIYVSSPVKRNCYNPDSYGEICVHCGCCSRHNLIRWSARLRLHQRELDRDRNFSNWSKGWIRVQRRNQKANIKYHNRRIARYSYLLRQHEASAPMM